METKIGVKTKTFEFARAAVNSRWLPWVIITLGIALRANLYLMNRSLWLDEATQALNIVQRGFLRLLEPLDHNQVAPIGYLMIERLAVRGLGDNEYALRLFPFLSGIATLFLFFRVAPKYVSRIATLIGLVLIAFSNVLTYYSQEVRQYSSDVAIALVVLWLGINLYQEEITWLRAVRAGVIGAVLVWFSHPAIFVLAGVGATLCVSDVNQKNWKRILLFSIPYAFWVGSFGIFHFWFGVNKYPHMVVALSGSFSPISQEFGSYQYWFIDRLLGFFQGPLGFTQWVLPLFAFLAGGLSMLGRDRARTSLLLAPLGFAFLASVLRGYPFDGRWLMYMVPAFLLLIAEGTGRVAQWLGDRSLGAAVLFAGFLIMQPFLNTDPPFPANREEIRPVLASMSQHYQSGDTIYVYYFAVYAYLYYAPHIGLPTDNFVQGVSGRRDWHTYERDLQKVKGNPRVWVIISHIYRGFGTDEERLFLHFLDNMGTRLDSYSAPGAAVYLYDLR